MAPSGKINLHLFGSEVLGGGRLYKEALYTLHNGIFDKVVALLYWREGLPLSEHQPSGLSIIRKKTMLNTIRGRGWLRNPSILRSVVSAIGYLERFLAAIRVAREQKPAYVSVHNADLLLPGVAAAWACSAELVYVPHELETERAGLSGLERLLAVLSEKLAVPRCHAVVAVCDPISDHYRAIYRHANVHTVRNLPQAEDVVIRNGSRVTYRDKYSIPPDVLTFVYQGLIEDARGLDDLLSIFSKTKHHLVLMGYGDGVPKLMSHLTPEIHYHPAVESHRIVATSASADVGIFINRASNTSYVLCLPNKFFEYLHAGLPVVVSDNMTYLAELVKANGLGWVAPIDQIAQVITSMNAEDVVKIKARVVEFARGMVWESDADVFRHVYSS